MGKAIVVGLVFVLIALIIAGVVIYHIRRSGKEKALERGWPIKGDLNRRQERVILEELRQAEVLFRDLLTPPTDLLGEMTFLKESDRVKIQFWLIRRAKISNYTREVES